MHQNKKSKQDLKLHNDIIDKLYKEPCGARRVYTEKVFPTQTKAEIAGL